MLINETDERLIQRCVDDELSPPETRALLLRLDRLDGGWKKLACELLEDRGLSKTLRSPHAQAGAGTVSVGVLRSVALPTVNRPTLIPLAASRALRHWWSHPVTSLSLCAAIAFVGGMLIPDLNSGRADSGVASNPGRSSSPNTVIPRAQNAVTGSADSYRIQMTPGGQSVEIPVYSGIPDLLRSDVNHPLFSESVLGADGRSKSIQWMIVPVAENKSMLIPVSQDTLGEMQ